jgi:hypothetical protein
LRVENKRDVRVSVKITIRSRENSASREFTLDLPPNERKKFEALDILEQPVTVGVHLDGTEYEYTPQTDGSLIVSIVSSGVEFEEVVT